MFGLRPLSDNLKIKMDYETEKAAINRISDPDVRAQAYCRLEAGRYLETSVRYLVMANTGKLPTPEVTSRLVSAIQTLAAEFR